MRQLSPLSLRLLLRDLFFVEQVLYHLTLSCRGANYFSAVSTVEASSVNSRSCISVFDTSFRWPAQLMSSSAIGSACSRPLERIVSAASERRVTVSSPIENINGFKSSLVTFCPSDRVNPFASNCVIQRPFFSSRLRRIAFCVSLQSDPIR